MRCDVNAVAPGSATWVSCASIATRFARNDSATSARRETRRTAGAGAVAPRGWYATRRPRTCSTRHGMRAWHRTYADGTRMTSPHTRSCTPRTKLAERTVARPRHTQRTTRGSTTRSSTTTHSGSASTSRSQPPPGLLVVSACIVVEGGGEGGIYSSSGGYVVGYSASKLIACTARRRSRSSSCFSCRSSI